MNQIERLTHREALGFFLNELGLIGSGVEVGCAFGYFSARILKSWKGSKLYMVDPWSVLPDEDYREITNKTAPFNGWYESCRELSAKDARVKLVRNRSVEASSEFKDGELDFVYIDANHDYRHVLEDMDSWFSKLKPGGLLGGHDYYNAKTDGHYCEVESAVKRWTAEHQLNFVITPCSSWWLLKP